MSIDVHVGQGDAGWLIAGGENSKNVKRPITRAFGNRYKTAWVDRHRVQASILVHVTQSYRDVSLNQLRVLECTVPQAQVRMHAGSGVDASLVDDDQIS